MIGKRYEGDAGCFNTKSTFRSPRQQSSGGITIHAMQ